jgi:hypothetical protein
MISGWGSRNGWVCSVVWGSSLVIVRLVLRERWVGGGLPPCVAVLD